MHRLSGHAQQNGASKIVAFTIDRQMEPAILDQKELV